MDRDAIQKQLDKIPNIPTLPQVALKVNQLLNDPGTSVRTLSETIMKDQAIVTNLLKLVNSAFYGFPSKIDNLSRAIMVLGYDTVRNAVLTVSVMKTLDKSNDSKDFTITDFWRHSIAVAVTCRQLAKRIPLEVPEACFVGGLVHDIGKVIMSRFFKEEFILIMASVREGKSFLDAERSVIPTDHAKIGGYLAKRWHLPENLTNAITFHHAPRKDIVGSNLTSLVHAADIIVNRVSMGDSPPPAIEATPEDAKIIMDLIESAPAWFSQIQAEIESACEFFQIN